FLLQKYPMKSFMIYLMLLFFVLEINAQDVTFALSPEQQLELGMSFGGHLHSNATDHYLYLIKKEGNFLSIKYDYVLQKYDGAMSLKYSKTLKSETSEIRDIELKYFNNKFARLQYKTNNDFTQFFITPITLDGEESNRKEIANMKYTDIGFPKISWQASNDASKILFIAESDTDQRKENYQVNLTMLDDDFNVLWTKDVKLPYSQFRFESSSWTVTNNGEVNFLGKINDEISKFQESIWGSRNIPSILKIYNISAEESQKSHDLVFEDAYRKGIKLHIHKKTENLALIGFTGDSAAGPIQGVTFMSLSAQNGSIIFTKTRDFTEKELDSFGRTNTSKDPNTDERGLDNNYIFIEIISTNDGGFTPVLEENTIDETTYKYSEANQRTNTTYNCFSIVSMSINSDGNINKPGIIPKKQSTLRAGKNNGNDPRNEELTDFQYYARFVGSNHVFYLYNDDQDNFKNNSINLANYKKLNDYNDAVAVLAFFDKDGNILRKQLFTKRETKTILMPKYCHQIDDNRMFLVNKKLVRFGKPVLIFGILTIK
ncbi:hypothetical protein N9B82_06200, partial [Saprospiraceae bacterium]|nr:hypothetical protein [Saprospiraceae bacterium]